MPSLLNPQENIGQQALYRGLSTTGLGLLSASGGGVPTGQAIGQAGLLGMQAADQYRQQAQALQMRERQMQFQKSLKMIDVGSRLLSSKSQGATQIGLQTMRKGFEAIGAPSDFLNKLENVNNYDPKATKEISNLAEDLTAGNIDFNQFVNLTNDVINRAEQQSAEQAESLTSQVKRVTEAYKFTHKPAREETPNEKLFINKDGDLKYINVRDMEAVNQARSEGYRPRVDISKNSVPAAVAEAQWLMRQGGLDWQTAYKMAQQTGVKSKEQFLAENEAKILTDPFMGQKQKDKAVEALRTMADRYYGDTAKEEKRIAVISKDGVKGTIPESQWPEAEKAGYKKQ